MKTHIGILAAALAFMMVSCSGWTEPEHLDFYRPGPGEENPEEYEAYLKKVRRYKKDYHNIMMLTMSGTSSHPSSQSQHPMAMPDSADYLCIKVPAEGLHPIIAAEIPQVKETKGTRSLLFVDYEAIHEAWRLLQDEKADNGEPAGTDQDAAAFFKTSTEKELAKAVEYGFSGLYVSYQGNTTTTFGDLTHTAFMTAIKTFASEHYDMELIFRGSARNVKDNAFLKEFSYLTIVADGEEKLSLLIGRILGQDGLIPKDRVIMELTVPSAEQPEQKGASVIEGAEWVLEEAGNREFTPCGLCISNAQDDYFHKGEAYYNIRKAITIMNQ